MRVLIVEDRVSDAELMLAELRSAGLECESSRVDNESDYLGALAAGFDVILADYFLPSFSAPRALDLLSERGIDLPLIVVTGMAGEEAAIECMKKGAADYLLKDRMARLGLAVQQSVAARALRRDQAEAHRRVEFQARLLDAVDHAVIATDLNRQVTYWNRAAEELCGWSALDALGRDALCILSPEALESQTDDIVEHRLRRGRSWSGEVVITRKDGSRFPGHVTTSPIRHAEELVGAISVFHDITEERRAEEAMQELAKFPAENPNPVMRILRGLQIAYANPASASVLRAWNRRVGDEVPPIIATAVKRCLQSSCKCEIEIECGTGVFAALIVPVDQSDYCNVYLRDITAQRQADLALRASEERLRLITDHVHDLVAQTTPDGVFLYASPSHEAVLGYTPGSLIGRSAMDIVHPDHQQRLLSVLHAPTASHTDDRVELQVRHADGHYVWLEAVSAGNPVGTVVSARDISQRKHLEADLQRRTEELERFNRLAVGRELRMIELKQQINDLSRRVGDPPPFAIEHELRGTAS